MAKSSTALLLYVQVDTVDRDAARRQSTVMVDALVVASVLMILLRLFPADVSVRVLTFTASLTFSRFPFSS